MNEIRILVDSGKNTYKAYVKDNQIIRTERVEIGNGGNNLDENSRLELEWHNAHPEGFVERLSQDYWILWNFNIGRPNSELKREHVDELRDIIVPRIREIFNEDKDATIFIGGHASHTGGDDINIVISYERAEIVGNYIVSEVPIDESKIQATYFGYDVPWHSVFAREIGKRLAQSRRVELSLFFVSRAVPKPPDDDFDVETDESYDEKEFQSFGGSYVIKREFKGQPKSYTYFTATPLAQVEAKIDVVNPNDDAKIVFENNKPKLEAKIGEEVGIDGLLAGVNSSEIEVKLEDQPISLVYNMDIDPTGPLLKYELNLEDKKAQLFTLDDGTQVTIGITVKFVVYIGASGSLKAKVVEVGGKLLAGAGSGSVAVGAAAVGGGIAGTFLLIGITGYLVEKAREEAIERGLKAHEIKGYTLRVAAEAIDNNYHYNRAINYLERSKSVSNDAYKEALNGWTLAEGIIDSTTNLPDMRNRLKETFGTSLEKIESNINIVIGPVLDPDAEMIPSTLEQLIEKADNVTLFK